MTKTEMKLNSGIDTAMWCMRHGVQESLVDGACPPCPRCREVQSKLLCVECEQHPATVTFSNGALDAIHGFTERICKCCYFKRVEKSWVEISENYSRLKAELEAEPCRVEQK